jgi:adenylylsulfate kinase-like enzyme
MRVGHNGSVLKMGNRIVWFTGLSGSGKTSIAMLAADRFGCEVLDGE